MAAYANIDLPIMSHPCVVRKAELPSTQTYGLNLHFLYSPRPIWSPPAQYIRINIMY
jgi:hypothetical protein